MKFTYPQKKWVLTSALLAVLGFNVSFNTHNDGIASADFASTSGDLTESKVYTAEGVMPVKYIDNGDEEVLALVPKRTTEGKVCEGKCGYDTIVLSAKNKSDIDALNVELMKKLAEQPAAPKKKVAKKEEVAEADAEATGEEVVEKKAVDHFEKLRKECKRHKEIADALSCLAPGFTDILNDEKKDVTSSEASKFFSEAIQPLLVEQLTTIRSSLNLQDRVKAGLISYDDNISFQWAKEDADTLKEKTLLLTRNLLAEIPRKHEMVRSKLLSAQSNLLKYEAEQAAALTALSLKTTNQQEFAYLTTEAEIRKGETSALASILERNSLVGIQSASSIGNITEMQKASYRTFLTESYLALLNAFAGKTTGTVKDPGIDLSGRLQNPGRGTIGTIQSQVPTTSIGTLPTTPGTIPSGVSSRTGGTALSTQTQTQLNVHPNSSGVTFGTPRDATAEALQQRALIRGRQ
ncbi:hypothetical protein [Bdellovibrio bacteriovorus]|uniref:Uncharacterized protein n=1 Tax=Bdellovibrio bacteriovorus str. Tiberius TaxID=1069642 RepID=K7YSV6_BDEBC|nr:hypothetical protein [Bdellovibrio bacteriovorus]AFY02941.1 hypothetical protein Bdt_3266 [Bdellovibrio bacteriovorus str. Tiberius]